MTTSTANPRHPAGQSAARRYCGTLSHRRRGLRRCYSDRVPLLRPHRVHPDTPHTPPTRLAPLLHRPRTPVPAYRAHPGTPRTPPTRLAPLLQRPRTRFRPHRALPGTPHTPPTRLAPLLQRPRTPVAAARAASGGCVYLRILRAALLARLFAKAAFIMATVPHQSRP